MDFIDDISFGIKNKALPILGRINHFVIFFKPILPNIIIVALGGISLSSLQGKDVVANVGFSTLFVQFWFLFFIFLTGIVAWLWTRMITNSQSVLKYLTEKTKASDTKYNVEKEVRKKPFKDAEENKTYQVGLPIILGACPFIFAGVALLPFLKVDGYKIWFTFSALVFSFVVYLAIVGFEFNLSREIAGLAEKKTSSDKTRKGIYTRGVAVVAAGVTAAFAFFFVFAFWLSPYAAPKFFGPGGLAFGAFAMLIPTFSILVIASYNFRMPFILILMGIYLWTGIDWKGWDKTHEIRRIGKPTEEISKLSISAGFDDWISKNVDNLKECEVDIKVAASSIEDQEPIYCAPIVFVSITGGATRAAYFSQSVLSYLETASDFEFHKDVFSISAVSGGALGAISYSGALDIRASKLENNIDVYSREKFAKKMAEFNGQDFLSSTLTGLLYLDPIEDLMGRLGHFVHYRDRAAGLEMAFEAGWMNSYLCHKDYEAECENSITAENKFRPFMLKYPFMSLFPNSKKNNSEWRPALMLIGTHLETGKRILTGHLKPPSNVDILDFHEEFGGDVRSSTAVMNSARFPIVSPPGAIVNKGELRGHVLDGGYFEGDGIETSLDIFEDVILTFKKHQSKDDKIGSTNIRYKSIRLLPIFVEINSGDTLPEIDTKRCQDSNCELPTRGILPKEISETDEKRDKKENSKNKGKQDRKVRFMLELSGPLKGLLNTRNGRGVMGAKRVSERIYDYTIPEREHISPEYVQFLLCLSSSEKKQPTAVSWALSEISKADIDTILFNQVLNVPEHLSKNHDLRTMIRRIGPINSCIDNNQKSAQRVLELMGK